MITPVNWDMCAEQRPVITAQLHKIQVHKTCAWTDYEPQ